MPTDTHYRPLLRYAEHVTAVLNQLDDAARILDDALSAVDGITDRTRAIDELRASRPRPDTPKDHCELVAAIDQRLTTIRNLITVESAI